MRNPIRLKNFRLRFLPYILIGLVAVVLRRPPPEGFAMGLPLVLAGVALRTWGAGLLVATGFASMLGGLWTLVVLAFVWPWFVLHYFPRKERAESARLAARHGERFTRYRAEVPPLWPRWSRFRPAGARAAPTDRPGGGVESDAGTRVWRLERYSENNELGTLLAILAALVLLASRSFWGRP